MVKGSSITIHSFDTISISGPVEMTDKLTFDTKITYFDQKANNYIKAGEDFANVNRQIVRLPTNIGTEYIREPLPVSLTLTGS